MKKIIIASAVALVSAYVSLPASASTSEATCVTNWVGGACGTTLNNGGGGSGGPLGYHSKPVKEDDCEK